MTLRDQPFRPSYDGQQRAACVAAGRDGSSMRCQTWQQQGSRLPRALVVRDAALAGVTARGRLVQPTLGWASRGALIGYPGGTVRPPTVACLACHDVMAGKAN